VAHRQITPRPQLRRDLVEDPAEPSRRRLRQRGGVGGEEIAGEVADAGEGLECVQALRALFDLGVARRAPRLQILAQLLDRAPAVEDVG